MYPRIGQLGFLSHDFKMSGLTQKTKKKGHIVGGDTFPCWHPEMDFPNLKKL